MSIENFKMFRYLSKHYSGVYRVKTHAIDLDLDDFPRDDYGVVDPEIDDEYIPCAQGEIRGTYHTERGKEILCWYTDSLGQGNNVRKKIKETYPDMWINVTEESSYDYIIEFNAEDIEKIASIVKPRTNGAKIRPLSEKNLPKTPYIIPEKDEKAFSNIIKDMDRVQKMFFVRQCCTEFDEQIQNAKGKKYNVATERKKSKLTNKQFIHSIGMWKEFVAFTKERYKEYASK